MSAGHSGSGTEREREGKKEKKGKKLQDSLNSLFMCLLLHLDCTAELLPSAPGLAEAQYAERKGAHADKEKSSGATR